MLSQNIRVPVHTASKIADSSFKNRHTKVNNLSSKPSTRTRPSYMRDDWKANEQKTNWGK